MATTKKASDAKATAEAQPNTTQAAATDATTTAEPKPTTENKVERTAKKVEVFVVKALAEGFRRAGMAFTREAQYLDKKVLSKDQVQAIKDEPKLSVTEDTVPAHQVTPVAGQAKAD